MAAVVPAETHPEARPAGDRRPERPNPCNNALIYATEHLIDATDTVSLRNAAGHAAADTHRVLNVVMHSQFAAVATTDKRIGYVHRQEPAAIGNLLGSCVQAPY
ncbi:hypothetical protein [Nocardia terpenica]|uniref:Uncharacterized protein n=1 Tax=Nocardia terpenica TaxID=455432 RepID=A0A164NFK0_9NOCA|nr:hypothetical protein [Nocardia terpenica]KZM74309.1 hypothetical protein AWN90_24740 [Nocardia terpenica]NQE93116.1 hypothetical protein [Nocardia terpenica]